MAADVISEDGIPRDGAAGNTSLEAGSAMEGPGGAPAGAPFGIPGAGAGVGGFTGAGAGAGVGVGVGGFTGAGAGAGGAVGDVSAGVGAACACAACACNSCCPRTPGIAPKAKVAILNAESILNSGRGALSDVRSPPFIPASQRRSCHTS